MEEEAEVVLVEDMMIAVDRLLGTTTVDHHLSSELEAEVGIGTEGMKTGKLIDEMIDAEGGMIEEAVRGAGMTIEGMIEEEEEEVVMTIETEDMELLLLEGQMAETTEFALTSKIRVTVNEEVLADGYIKIKCIHHKPLLLLFSLFSFFLSVCYISVGQSSRCRELES